MFVGLLENRLPGFWKPSLSRLFAGGEKGKDFRAAEKLDPRQRAARAVSLRSRGHYYGQIAQELGVSKSTVVNYIRDYPYSR